MLEFLKIVGASFCLVSLFMSLLWIYYYYKKNSTVVDIGWTGSFILVSFIVLILGNGWLPRKLLLTAMVVIWAGRLITHLYQRLMTTKDDPRYVTIKENWGSQNIDFKFYLMFLFQGFLALILSLPFIFVGLDTSEEWSVFEGWAVIVWLIGVVGEAIADNQLNQFKSDPKNAGQVCQEGLWYYSRHPNYFFEFIVWIGFFLFSLGTFWGMFAIVSPILMLFLLLKVSGVPFAEEQALKSRPQAYADYQRTTSSFIPWFRKKPKD